MIWQRRSLERGKKGAWKLNSCTLLHYGSWLVKACHDIEHFMFPKVQPALGVLMNQFYLEDWWRLYFSLMLYFFHLFVCFSDGEIVAYH